MRRPTVFEAGFYLAFPTQLLRSEFPFRLVIRGLIVKRGPVHQPGKRPSGRRAEEMIKPGIIIPVPNNKLIRRNREQEHQSNTEYPEKKPETFP